MVSIRYRCYNNGNTTVATNSCFSWCQFIMNSLGVTSGAGNAYPSVVCEVRVAQSLIL